MLATKPVALAYGGAVCLAGWVVSLLLFELGTLWAILPATSGFFLIGPLVAAGLYEASRLREQGRQPTWPTCSPRSAATARRSPSSAWRC